MSWCSSRAGSIGTGSTARSRRSTATKAGPGSRLASLLGCCCSSTSSPYPTRRCVSVGSMIPYFQYFTGEEFFQHAFPHERSDLSHWRKRLGEKLELLLAESLRVAHEAGALRTRDLKRVTVDTTVQPKAITFPTDAKLLHAAIQGLNRLARRHAIRLRQSYLRIAKRAAMM